MTIDGLLLNTLDVSNTRRAEPLQSKKGLGNYDKNTMPLSCGAQSPCRNQPAHTTTVLVWQELKPCHHSQDSRVTGHWRSHRLRLGPTTLRALSSSSLIRHPLRGTTESAPTAYALCRLLDLVIQQSKRNRRGPGSAEPGRPLGVTPLGLPLSGRGPETGPARGPGRRAG